MSLGRIRLWPPPTFWAGAPFGWVFRAKTRILESCHRLPVVMAVTARNARLWCANTRAGRIGWPLKIAGKSTRNVLLARTRCYVRTHVRGDGCATHMGLGGGVGGGGGDVTDIPLLSSIPLKNRNTPRSIDITNIFLLMPLLCGGVLFAARARKSKTKIVHLSSVK